ncbi:hypothetical protein QFC24_001870 [Naganishia onofrii]|uniref:Uncharacterized protein n=1 Tax=Naganishia onofrii TaxID=1851511 RepID=A0ACC2XUB8_9TREE|nr:hypothetical protein QFC24_001870 [Naganishia onofrii]
MCGSRAINGMKDIRNEDNESNGGYLFDGACTAINGLFHDTTKLASERATFEEAADVVRGIASRNLSISVSLTGIILLQAGRYYSERSYEKSRISAEAEELLRKTAPLGIDEATMSSAVNTDSEGDLPTEGIDRLRKRGRAQTPYRELSEEAAMNLSVEQEPAL